MSRLSSQTRGGRGSAPMRLGMLNVLMMVIALCLAVLAVLSLATAQAGARLSERQGQAVRDASLVESMGQRFVAEVDGLLLAFQSGDVPPERWLAAMERGAQDSVVALLALPEAQEAGMSMEVSALTLEDLDQLLVEPVSAEAAIGALEARMTSASGQCLDCIIALSGDGSYDIMQWKMTKLWDEQVQTESLLRMEQHEGQH